MHDIVTGLLNQHNTHFYSSPGTFPVHLCFALLKRCSVLLPLMLHSCGCTQGDSLWTYLSSYLVKMQHIQYPP